jgi:hypothetical protein
VTASRFEFFDRDKNVMDLAPYVTRRVTVAVTQQPHDFHHRLAGTLIGNPVNDNDGDAIGRVQGWPARSARQGCVLPSGVVTFPTIRSFVALPSNRTAPPP